MLINQQDVIKCRHFFTKCYCLVNIQSVQKHRQIMLNIQEILRQELTVIYLLVICRKRLINGLLLKQLLYATHEPSSKIWMMSFLHVSYVGLRLFLFCLFLSVLVLTDTRTNKRTNFPIMQILTEKIQSCYCWEPQILSAYEL